MLKKSFVVIGIQSLNIILNVFSMYILARNMQPAVYSLIGIYSIITGIMSTFTHYGIETIMMRNALDWKNNGHDELVVENFTHSIVVRVVSAIFLSPILMTYLIFLSFAKYDGRYLVLFVIYIFSGIGQSILASIHLMIKSLGSYIYMQIIDVFNSTVFKITALIMYIYKGDMAYLYVWSSMPILMSVVLCIIERKRFCFSYIQWKVIIPKIKEMKYFWLKCFLDYGKVYSDNLIVSLLFSSDVMGIYTLFKSMEQVCKSFIEGFFDPLAQDTIRFKSQPKDLLVRIKKVLLARNIILIPVCIGIVCYWVFRSKIIALIGFSHYPNIEIIILSVGLYSLLYIGGKIEINMVMLYDTAWTNFRLSVILFVANILTLLVSIYIYNINAVIFQRIIIQFLYSGMSISLFRRILMKKNF